MLIYLKSRVMGKWKGGEGGGKRQIFHLPNGHNSWGWAWPKPEVKDPIRVLSHWEQGFKYLSHHPLLSRHIDRAWIRSGAAGTQSIILIPEAGILISDISCYTTVSVLFICPFPFIKNLKIRHVFKFKKTTTRKNPQFCMGESTEELCHFSWYLGFHPTTDLCICSSLHSEQLHNGHLQLQEPGKVVLRAQEQLNLLKCYITSLTVKPHRL